MLYVQIKKEADTEEACMDANPEVEEGTSLWWSWGWLQQYLWNWSACHLFFLYDCKITRLSIYANHINDIAAKVIHLPVEVNVPTFTSMVKTGRTIFTTGKYKNS